MKLLFWILILIAVILAALAVTHDMIVSAYRCRHCGQIKEIVEVTCLGQRLHESGSFDTPCPKNRDHLWQNFSILTERGIRGCIGRDVETEPQS